MQSAHATSQREPTARQALPRRPGAATPRAAPAPRDGMVATAAVPPAARDDALAGLLARAVAARAAGTGAPLIQRTMGKVTTGTTVDLDAHEEDGGHTIERHVAKSASFIQNRVIGQELDAASTFPDKTTAATVATAGVRENSTTINTILFSAQAGAANRAFVYDAGRDIGQFLEHGNVMDKKGRLRKERALKSGATSATVVVHINWSPAPPHTWHLLTCYPNPPA
jgi:hypothetical protein